MQAKAVPRNDMLRRGHDLPPDFLDFVEWVNSLNISRGVKQSIIAGARRAFLRGLRSVEDVKRLPKGTTGRKAMKYGMAKYEEFRALLEVFY